jgi:hypothetical protein
VIAHLWNVRDIQHRSAATDMTIDLEPVVPKWWLRRRISSEVIPDVLILYRQLTVAATRTLCYVNY